MIKTNGILRFSSLKLVFLIFINLLAKQQAFASQNLDSSFGAGLGYISTQYSQGFQVNKIRIQSDGKIVAVGLTQNPNTQAIIARYNTDGSLDNTFGTSGIVTGNVGSSLSTTVINDAAIQTDDKIVVVGYTYDPGVGTSVLVARYTTSGTLDGTFASGGVFSALLGNGSSINSVVLQSDGKIVIAGTVVINDLPNSLVARFTTAGALDSTFGSVGYITGLVGNGTVLNSVKLDSSENIVITGYYSPGSTDDQFLVARYTNTGTLDSTFNSSGIVLGSVGTRSRMNSLVVDGSDNIIVGGFINFGTEDQFVVGRYTNAGALDTTFNSPNGYISQLIGNNSRIQDLVIQGDGKIVVGGFINYFIDQATVARYNTDGTADTTFGSGGTISLNLANGSRINGLALQTDQKVVSGGYLIDQSSNQQFANVVRFNKNNTDFVNFNSPLAQDATINTKIPTISGTSSAASAQVQILINGVEFTTVATDGSGNWNAGSSVLSVGTNVIKANLIVSAVTVVSNEVSFTVEDKLGEDSVFAYSTTSQTTTTLNTFQTITFLNPPPIINTWTFNGTDTFTCNVAGKYLIEYSAETGIAAALTVDANISVRVLNSSTEITASQANNQLSVNLGVTSTKTCSRSFILNLNTSDTIQFQYATDTSDGGILSGTGNGTTRPSIGISIVRLQ